MGRACFGLPVCPHRRPAACSVPVRALKPEAECCSLNSVPAESWSVFFWNVGEASCEFREGPTCLPGQVWLQWVHSGKQASS